MKKFIAKKEEKKKKPSLINKDFKSGQFQTVKNAKGMKISSSNWLRRHINDKFVQMSKQDGYLSRAVYKIIEINEKFPILSANTKTILDLGCSPGSWSQVLNELFNYRIRIVGIDLNECDYSHENFTFIQGDFEDTEVQHKAKEALSCDKIDLIMSDISHNLIGNPDVDRILNVRIFESCLDFASEHMSDHGGFIFKSLCGSYQVLAKRLKDSFVKVDFFKPKSSRQDSSEIYVVCIGKK